MSSRKTATARKPAAKSVRPAKPARAVEKPTTDGASADALKLAAEIERSIASGARGGLSQDAMQTLTAALCRSYGMQVEAGQQFMPVKAMSLSPTDVMVTASGLLKAVNLAVFELGMWQSWTGR